LVLGSRITGAIVDGLAGRCQLYFTDKSVVIVETPRFGFSRLNYLRLAKTGVIPPDEWDPTEDYSGIIQEIDKRKKNEIPIEQILSIDMVQPKRGLILKGKPGLIRLWLTNGRAVDVKIDIEAAGSRFDSMVQLMNTLFPGKVKVTQQ